MNGVRATPRIHDMLCEQLINKHKNVVAVYWNYATVFLAESWQGD